MKGKHIISIVSRKAIYHLELERKISVLKGNSGTGKSSMIRLIAEYLEYGKQSGVKLSTDSIILNGQKFSSRYMIRYCSLTKMSVTCIARVFSGNCGQRTAMLLLFHEAAGLQLCLIQSSEYMNLSQKKRE